jgi:hypothetical protein
MRAARLAFLLFAIPALGWGATGADKWSAAGMVRRYKAGDPYAALAIHNVVDGFDWANGELTNSKARQLYCLPTKLALTTEQETDILERYLRENAAAYSAGPFELALLKGLEEDFPCK